MALPININDLLNKRKVESNRIEFKAGWNPDKIYHTICAFATDLENIGGGYILVGVEEENGIAKRPVKGLDESEIDHIMKDMVGYDAKISPSYLTKVSPEEVDGQMILVIWAPAGINRPYSVMESVVAKKSTPKFYVRSKSSTIEAKGEILDEVRELANRVPFDERGNEAMTINDISGVRVYEHLKAVGSKLVEQFGNKPLLDILDEMDLLVGPIEKHLRLNGNNPATIETDENRTYFLMTIPCREGFKHVTANATNSQNDIVDTELLQRLGHASVKVQEYVNQSIISDKPQLLQILLQISVKVWDKSRKVVDKSLLSRVLIDLFEFLQEDAQTIKNISLYTHYSEIHELRRKLLIPLIDMGYISMTDPDKPKSSKQAYRLTQKGKDLFYSD
ncbi:MAG: helix-turn-helix domain-containing protein [Parabacteroides sp.]